MNKIPYIILFICFISMTILAYKNNEVIKLQNKQIYIYQQKNIDNILWNYYICNFQWNNYRVKINSLYIENKNIYAFANSNSANFTNIILNNCKKE